MRERLMTGWTRWILLLGGATTILLLFVLAERQPDLFASSAILGAILALQIALFGLSRFEEAFFPLLIGTFLWAGSSLPLYSTATSLRWLFLAIGALGGFLIWIRRPRPRHFGSFHLVAMLCVASAVVTAAVSEVPKTSLLKVLSLFLLFLYTSSGARVANAGRERKFVNSLVLACEMLVYFSAACYFLLHFRLFGNTNALGAVIGVVAVPILLWAATTAETRGLRQRRFFALLLSGGLLFLSNSRASILGAALVIVLFTVAIRQQRLLLQCVFICVFFLTVMAVVNPTQVNELIFSVTDKVLYKERGAAHGVFASRLSPWRETLSVVKQHPWFGSGFGTSEVDDLAPASNSSSIYTKEGTNREHGNSYLALAEYLGILGCVPFLVLLFMLLRTLADVYRWMRKNQSAFHYSVPFALVASAGLVHAFFEDWLFAVGSYLCVFFWVAAFILIDLVPPAERNSSTILFQPSPRIMAVSPDYILVDKWSPRIGSTFGGRIS